MDRQRIILVSGSRLLEEMLKRIFQKTEYLQVVQEVRGENAIPAPNQQLEADWVIQAMPLSLKLADWVKRYIKEHPRTNSLSVSADGSRVQIRRQDKRPAELDGLSLPALLQLLQASGDTS